MNKSGFGLITTSIFGVLAITLFFMTYYSVDQFERVVLTRFGEVQSVEGPGLHFKTPFVHSVTSFNTQIQEVTTKKAVNTYTVDNQEVDIGFTIQFRIIPEKVLFVYQNVRDYEQKLLALAIDRLKAELGKVNTQHVAEKRGEIRNTIENILKVEALAKFGLSIEAFLLTDINYTESYRKAVEAAASAKAMVETREQEKQQALLTAERQRIEAKGTADSLLLNREAEAKAIELKGKAEAAAIKAQADALAANVQLVELEKAKRWNGQLPQSVFAGAPIPFLDILKK